MMRRPADPVRLDGGSEGRPRALSAWRKGGASAAAGIGPHGAEAPDRGAQAVDLLEGRSRALSSRLGTPPERQCAASAPDRWSHFRAGTAAGPVLRAARHGLVSEAIVWQLPCWPNAAAAALPCRPRRCPSSAATYRPAPIPPPRPVQLIAWRASSSSSGAATQLPAATKGAGDHAVQRQDTRPSAGCSCIAVPDHPGEGSGRLRRHAVWPSRFRKGTRHRSQSPRETAPTPLLARIGSSLSRSLHHAAPTGKAASSSTPYQRSAKVLRIPRPTPCCRRDLSRRGPP